MISPAGWFQDREEKWCITCPPIFLLFTSTTIPPRSLWLVTDASGKCHGVFALIVVRLARGLVCFFGGLIHQQIARSAEDHLPGKE